jgi:hypothetical protein
VTSVIISNSITHIKVQIYISTYKRELIAPLFVGKNEILFHELSHIEKTSKINDLKSLNLTETTMNLNHFCIYRNYKLEKMNTIIYQVYIQ